MATTTLRDLPGPNTASKRAAMEFSDPRFQAMLTVAAETQWPVVYTNDLYVHDYCTILASSPDDEFVFVLRETGTHLKPIACKEEWEALDQRQACQWLSGHHTTNYNNGIPLGRFFHVRANGNISEVSADEACELFTVVR